MSSEYRDQTNANIKNSVPTAMSEEMKHAISTRPTPTVQQVKRVIPETYHEWLELIQKNNADQKKKIKNMRKAFAVTVSKETINGVTVRVVIPERMSPEFEDHVYIDVHGGAYVFFAGLPSIEEGILIAVRLGIKVICIDYRMPPFAPSPAASEDIFSVYIAMLKTYSAKRIFIGGTSAGASLVLTLVQRLVKYALPRPVAIYIGTPWADLTKTGDTLFTNEGIDRILVTYDGLLAAAAKLYAGDTPLDHPSISPLYGAFEHFPPTYLVSGTRDMFLSDTVRVNRGLRDVGVKTTLDVYEGLSHADYLVAHGTPESRACYSEIKQFFIESLGEKRETRQYTD